MTTYENLKDKPKRFLALTGYTLEEFWHSCRTFLSVF